MSEQELKESNYGAYSILRKRDEDEYHSISKRHKDIANSHKLDKPAHGKAKLHARFHHLKQKMDDFKKDDIEHRKRKKESKLRVWNKLRTKGSERAKEVKIEKTKRSLQDRINKL